MLIGDFWSCLLEEIVMLSFGTGEEAISLTRTFTISVSIKSCLSLTVNSNENILSTDTEGEVKVNTAASGRDNVSQRGNPPICFKNNLNCHQGQDPYWRYLKEIETYFHL